ncbi:hypothetical protein CGLO_01282 [Colletotrichum gloeosporioides Cg-14]|uniref:HNH nuclease domain-containing protein n=1 Tax=Colletotrichum gloeosporioides (strain Cg-14) TaxID=1237896 RepID=T0MBX4_COLGC|nr:hypothetical protein CGLO_01282 [Colletotrichum gloeosporioides Cg-14]
MANSQTRQMSPGEDAHSRPRDPSRKRLNELYGRVVDRKTAAMTDVQQQLKDLTASHVEGTSGLSDRNFQEQFKRLEEDVYGCEKELSLVLLSKNQLIGILQDVDECAGGLRDKDKAYINRLVGRLTRTHGFTAGSGTRQDNAEQQTFRQRVIERYDPCKGKEKPGPRCSISGIRWQVVATHIANVNLGEATARELFGKDSEDLGGGGHLNNPLNGLLMHRDLEKAWRAGRFLIVSDDFVDDSGRRERGLKVVVLDFELEKKFHGYNYDISTPQLHGRRLTFLNNNRPSNKYLNFAYTMTVLRRQGLQATPSTTTLDRRFMQSAARKVWASTDSDWGQSLLFQASRQLGFLTEEEVRQFYHTKQTPPKSSALEDRKLKTAAIEVSSILRQPALKHDTELM